MNRYLIASVRGSDFVAEGITPQEAWKNLCEKEKDNGSLWKTGDSLRNKTAVAIECFTFFDASDPSKGAYKKIASTNA